jgi:hypothetical protein
LNLEKNLQNVQSDLQWIGQMIRYLLCQLLKINVIVSADISSDGIIHTETQQVGFQLSRLVVGDFALAVLDFGDETFGQGNGVFGRFHQSAQILEGLADLLVDHLLLRLNLFLYSRYPCSELEEEEANREPFFSRSN